jgi:hypothetical protein
VAHQLPGYAGAGKGVYCNETGSPIDAVASLVATFLFFLAVSLILVFGFVWFIDHSIRSVEKISLITTL